MCAQWADPIDGGLTLARIRTIKPEFWTSPGVVSLDPYARLLFIGSWNFADDFGLLPDDPERLRLQVLPADPVDAEQLVAGLLSCGMYERVTAPSGDQLLLIPTWDRHQKIDSRTKGKWGNPTEWGTPPDPTRPHPAPPDPALGIGSGVGTGTSLPSSTDGLKTQRAEEEISPKAAAVVEHVVKLRLAGQHGIRNTAAWSNRCRNNLRTEGEGAWWARMLELVEGYPEAPVDMLAANVEGHSTPYLKDYAKRQAS